MGSATSQATASSAKSVEKPCVLLRSAGQRGHACFRPRSAGGKSAQGVKGWDTKSQPAWGLSSQAHTSGGWEGTNFGWQAALLPRLGLSRHLVSLRLAFVCAPGYHTGRPGRVPPPGVPSWVQVPEGVIYATIALGIACPRAGVPVVPCLLPGSETGACARVATALPVPCLGPACRRARL